MTNCVGKTKLEGTGLEFIMASFLTDNIWPEGIKEDQSTPMKVHKTAEEFKKDAEALNNPSSKVQ
jgi:hypothetical protein